ncbi:helix-turn-helix transcriptional regulator [Aquirufa regiilacus]
MKLKKEELVVLVGSNIREIRKEKGLTIEKLAHEAEIESKQLRRIELGQINTSIYQVYNLSYTLNVPLQAIFSNVQAKEN